MTGPVLWSIDARGVATITLNRPARLNALDTHLATALAQAARAVTAEAGLRAILLCGAGRAFCAGGDVAEFGAEPGRARAVLEVILDGVHEAVARLNEADAPVIARVQGVAAGAGLSLALGADLVVAAEDARFLLAYDRLGAPPDGGSTWFIARRLSRQMAAELMYLGRELTAPEAQAAGIVTRLAAPDALDGAADDLAGQVARGPTRAYGAFRRLLAGAHGATLAEQLDAERAAFLANTDTADFRAGVAGFAARRTALFNGQ